LLVHLVLEWALRGPRFSLLFETLAMPIASAFSRRGVP